MFKRILFLTVVTLFFSFPVKGATHVIVNMSVPNSSVSTHTLSRIYAMQLKSWNSGETIKVFMLPSKHKIHREFSRKQLRMPTHQLDRLWNRLTFTGTGRTPVVVKSESEMLEKIRSTPGAIGYVSGNLPLKGVKVLESGQNHE
ncbi:MAG: hypothetical protein U9R28_10800 [Pseudomonadota bacterium]|nr:hypothetical protein [Pseudomonadota bacterium]